MAKSMAIIENGIVKNIVWCTDKTVETGRLINTWQKRVQIGDEYREGKFYRDDIEVLSVVGEFG